MEKDRYGDLLPDGAIQRLGNVRFASPGLIAVLPDETLLMAGNELRWTDMRTGEISMSRTVQHPPIRVLAVSLNGEMIATADDCATIVLWSARGDKLNCMGQRTCGRKQVRRRSPSNQTDAIIDLAFMAHSNKLVSVQWDGTLTAWDITTGSRMKSEQLPNKGVVSMGFGPESGCATFEDGNLVAFALDDFRIIWSHPAERIARCAGEILVTAAAAPDGSAFATMVVDGTLRFWEQSTGRLIAEKQPPGRGNGAMAFSPNANLFAVSDGGGPIDMLAVPDYLGRYRIDVSNDLGPLCFTPDNQKLISVCGSGIQIWDTKDGHELLRAFGPTFSVFPSMFLYPDGGHVALGEVAGNCVWDLENGKRSGKPVPKYRRIYSSNGRIALDHDFDQPIVVVDLEKQEEKWFLEGQKTIEALALSPNGTFLASAGKHVAGCCGSEIWLWNLTTGERNGGVQSRVLAPKQLDDRSLAATIWEANKLVFSLDERVLASAGTIFDVAPPYQCIRLWLVPELKLWKVLWGGEGEIPWKGLTFSPDGSLVCAGTLDKSICIWDIERDNVRWNLQGHSGDVEAIAISSDNRLLASGDSGGTIRVWCLRSGKNICKFDGHKGKIFGLAFHPSKELLISAAADNTVLTWKVGALVNDALVQRR
jgi:WD40 repeat protein